MEPKHNERRSPGRAGLPITLAPLTPEEALRKAMQFKPTNVVAPKAKALDNKRKRKKKG